MGIIAISGIWCVECSCNFSSSDPSQPSICILWRLPIMVDVREKNRPSIIKVYVDRIPLNTLIYLTCTWCDNCFSS